MEWSDLILSHNTWLWLNIFGPQWLNYDRLADFVTLIFDPYSHIFDIDWHYLNETSGRVFCWESSISDDLLVRHKFHTLTPLWRGLPFDVAFVHNKSAFDWPKSISLQGCQLFLSIQEMSCRCIFEGAPVNIISIQGALCALHDCWWWPMHNDVKIGKLATWSVRGLHDFHDVFCSFSHVTLQRGERTDVNTTPKSGSVIAKAASLLEVQSPTVYRVPTALRSSWNNSSHLALTFLRRETTPFQGQFLQVKLRATVGLPDKTGRKIIRQIPWLDDGNKNNATGWQWVLGISRRSYRNRLEGRPWRIRGPSATKTHERKAFAWYHQFRVDMKSSSS